MVSDENDSHLVWFLDASPCTDRGNYLPVYSVKVRVGNLTDAEETVCGPASEVRSSMVAQQHRRRRSSMCS